MKRHRVRVYESAQTPARNQLLGWKLAEVAADDAPLDPDAVEMIVNRVIDNTGVAVAGLSRRPVANARAQALAHPHTGGGTVFGLPRDCRAACEWATWANCTAVRELDFHDTFLAADMNHPGDMIPPVIAVGQQVGASGLDLVRGLAAAYEICVALTKSICLHEHRIDHLPHIAAGMVVGIGSMMHYQALNHAVHVTITTRQSRKGEISTWKASAPAHADKPAVEAIDRALRGETSPAPIYEGDDSIVAWLLDGPNAKYEVPLPDPGEPKRAILETFTKAHSGEVQSQALIDLAFRVRRNLSDLSRVSDIEIHTSHHTHRIIGTGAGDPQKFSPEASRETLDHSAMYIFAVALEDGRWHHTDSYAPERAHRPETVMLWNKIHTVEDPRWTARYHAPDPRQRAFGGHVVITMEDGRTITDSIDVAHAHPLGATPFARDDYVKKFLSLSAELATSDEPDRFLGAALDLAKLQAGGLVELTMEVPDSVRDLEELPPGLFERHSP